MRWLIAVPFQGMRWIDTVWLQPGNLKKKKVSSKISLFKKYRLWLTGETDKIINTQYTHSWEQILGRQWWDPLHFHMFCSFSAEMPVNLFFTGPCTRILHGHCFSPFGCYSSSPWTGDTYILNMEDKSISNGCHTITVTVFWTERGGAVKCQANLFLLPQSTGGRDDSTKQLCSWLFACKSLMDCMVLQVICI